jgi:hypothetical protein
MSLQAAGAFSNLQLDDIASIKANLASRIEHTKNEPAKKAEEKKLVDLPSSIQPEEQDEPLLQENKQRFVLFPIKYHEVGLLCCHQFHMFTR